MTYGETYAEGYDQLYRDKDYAGECDLVEEAFRRTAVGAVKSVVDFGCGTGNHAIPLSQRGFRLTGVDASEAMLAVARRKAAAIGADVDWRLGDIRTARVGGPFDAGVFMFAVLGYLLPNDDVFAALQNARRHIRTGGVLVFDVWYGPAVLTIRPSDRAKVLPIAGGSLVRVVTPRLETRRHVCEVSYHLWKILDSRVESESEETHLVRFFFPMELEFFLSQSGFELTALTAFPTIDRPADESSWAVVGIARAR